MMRPFVGSWKELAVHGVAAVLFGLATLVWPSVTLWTLVVLWGAFVFVDGITALAAAFTDRALMHRGWLVFRGLTGILAGVVTFVWPSITAFALLFVIAAWAFLVGGARIAFAISMRKQVRGTWSIALGGVVLVLLGALLLVDPRAGAIGVTWAIGWLAVVYGSLELGLAAAVRRETRKPRTRRSSGASQPGHAMS